MGLNIQQTIPNIFKDKGYLNC